MHLVPLMKRTVLKNKRISAAVHAVWIAISGYGVYVFMQRGMPGYMFRRQIFAFIDESESKAVFFAEHAAVMLLFMFVGYGVIALMSELSNHKGKTK